MSTGTDQMPFDGKCPKCSGRPAKKCQKPSGCGVTFVDIGTGGCPFCRWPLARDV